MSVNRENNMKIARWVCKSEEFPGGMLFENKQAALQSSYDYRQDGEKAYVRKMYFTQEELDEFEEYV